MVGVPGRSKGCNTCIQRKIKCDQGTPQCRNCKKSNRLCTGYKRKLAYIMSSDMISDGVAKPMYDETTIHHHGRWRKTAPQKPSILLRDVPEPTMTILDTSVSRNLCLQISNIPAMRQQFHYLFFLAHLPEEMRGSRYRKPRMNANFLHHLQVHSTSSPVLEHSLAALFSAKLGRMNRDANLVHTSRSMYASGLELLQKALNNPRARLEDETLAACVTLSLYELSETTAGMQDAYVAHRKGAIMLLEMRGPEACTTPLGHSLFLAIRAQTITPCLTHHFDTFLSDTEWIEVPWKLVTKNPYDQIMDHLYKLPAMLRQLDELAQDRDQSMVIETISHITAEYIKIIASLQTLYGAFESSISGPLYWSELSTFESPFDDPTSGKVFPVSFYFPSFNVAQLLTTYWTALMVCHLHLMHIYNKLAKVTSLLSEDSILGLESTGHNLPSPASLYLRAQENNEKWSNMAKNICQSIPYFTQDTMGGLGLISSISLLYGCHVCMDNVPEQWTREMSWIVNLIKQVESKLDFPIGRVLLGE